MSEFDEPPRKRTRTTRALDQQIVRTAAPVVRPLSPVREEPLHELPTTTRTLVAIPTHALPVDPLQVRDAPPPTPGYRYTIDGRQVPLVESTADLENTSCQLVAAEILERTGSLRAVADALGVTTNKLKAQFSKDVEFAEAMEAAADRHREAIYASAYRRAVEGYEVPIVGGKDKDEIVAYERRFSDSLTQLLLKRHYPEFRDATKKEFTAVKITNNTLNQNFDPKSLPRADRDHLRRILKAPPEVIDETGVIDVSVEDPSSPAETSQEDTSYLDLLT